MMRSLLVATLGCALLSTVEVVQAQASFDCGRAQTPTERSICRYPALSQLDRDLAAAYAARRGALSPAGQGALLEAQRAFLRDRDLCRGIQGCLNQKMSARLAELRNGGSVASTPSNPATRSEEGTIDLADLQRRLNAAGYDAGPPDGVAGPRTRSAARRVLAQAGRRVVVGRELADAYGLLTELAAPDAAQVAAIQNPALAAGTQLTVAGLPGAYRLVTLALTGDIFTANPRYFLNPAPVVITMEGSRVRVDFPSNTGRTGPAFTARYRDEGSSEFAFLLRPEGSAGEMSRLYPKSMRSGVDILTNGNARLLIRFRRTPGAETLGIADLDFDQFCSGPAKAVAAGAQREIQATRSVSMDVQAAARLGLFGGPEFAATFGAGFDALENPVRTELVERLRACALYHPERQSGDAIRTALFGDAFSLATWAADAMVSQRGRFTGRQRELQVRPPAGAIGNEVAALEAGRAALAEAVPALSGPGVENITEAELDRIERIARSLPASEAGETLRRIDALRADRARMLAAAELAERDATLPPKAEPDLIRQASRDWMTANCSRGALLLQSVLNDGAGGGLVLLSRNVEAVGGGCQMDLGTHLLTFNVGSVIGSSCTSGDMASCDFTARFSCDYRINPDFGFDGNLGDLDPFCPVIELLPIDMEGVFRRNAPSRWTAEFLEF